MYMLYLQFQLKFSTFNIKTLKHCENLLRVSNEIKQYVKNMIVKSQCLWASFPIAKSNKIIKTKNDVIITTYWQISLKNTLWLVIDTAANLCFATTPINITPFWCSSKICHKVAFNDIHNKQYLKSTRKARNSASFCPKLKNNLTNIVVVSLKSKRYLCQQWQSTNILKC